MKMVFLFIGSLLVALLSVGAAIRDRFPGDLALTKYMQRLTAAPWEETMQIATLIGQTQYLIVAALALIAWFLRRKQKTESLVIFGAVVSLGLSLVVKKVVDRPRPADELVMVWRHHDSASFPSGHAPTITDPVIIDGYTQPGASPNTNGPGLGLNTVLKIELDGTNAGAFAPGLHITGDSTVRGLVINGFDGFGVLISGGDATGNLVQGNFIGTDVTGAVDLGNGRDGVFIAGAPNNVIGGTTAQARNVISGNNISGINIGGASGNVVQGNFIGTDVTGAVDVGNTLWGILMSSGAPENTIGGTAGGAGNTIAFNGFDGVFGVLGTGNAILGNSIFSNAGLGIDLDPDGITANDAGDGDTGANNLQNFPVLTSATSGNSTTVEMTLNSAANTIFRVEFFSNSACDPPGNGEGETFLGVSTDVTTDGSGDASPTIIFLTTVPVGQFITATATDPSNNTSEFSACQSVVSVVASADLSVTISDSPMPALLGSDLTYTITVTNNGPATATGVVMTDTLPAFADYISSSPSQGDSCSQAAGIVTCNLGTISDGANATVDIVVNPTATGTLSNLAGATAIEPDPVTGNNAVVQLSTVDPATDLSVTISDSPDPVTVGSPLTYTITITNNGPLTSTAVSLTSTLPGNVTYTSATPTQGNCGEVAGVVTCTLGIIVDGATATVSIVGNPTSAGSPTLSATVIGELADPNLNDNDDTEGTTVFAPPPPPPPLPPTLVSITILSPAATILVAGTLQFNATGAFSDGATTGVTGTLTWNSSDSEVVTITAGGLATAVGRGSVTITATDEATGLSDTATLRVVIPTAVPSISQWGLIGMAGLFAFLILVGIGMRKRASQATK